MLTFLNFVVAIKIDSVSENSIIRSSQEWTGMDCNGPAWNRTNVYFSLTHCKEGDSRAKHFSKDHG